MLDDANVQADNIENENAEDLIESFEENKASDKSTRKRKIRKE
jgi:hypothetical protein